jgi:predicted ester cyclase
MSQVETNKEVIKLYFEAYNTKNDAIFDEIIAPLIIEAMVASDSYPDLVGTYWKGSVTPKASPPDAPHTSKIINYRGVSIYRIQNGKMIETWHVSDARP